MLILVPTVTMAAYLATGFEKPPVLHAKDLVPATLLGGKGFQVDDAVPTDGLTAIFALHTDLGTLQVHGIELLRIRVTEVPAMEELEHESKTKVFAQALARTGVEPVKAAGTNGHASGGYRDRIARRSRALLRPRQSRRTMAQGGCDGAGRGLSNREGRRSCHPHWPHCQGHSRL